MIPQDLIDNYGECAKCGHDAQIGHITEFDKQEQKMLTKHFHSKDFYIVFCPKCEDMGIVRNK